MKKVKSRATAALMIAAAIIVGLVGYIIRYADHGADWVMFSANANVYQNGGIANGAVCDRNGVLLAEAENGTLWYDEPARSTKLRRATF